MHTKTTNSTQRTSDPMALSPEEDSTSNNSSSQRIKKKSTYTGRTYFRNQQLNNNGAVKIVQSALSGYKGLATELTSRNIQRLKTTKNTELSSKKQRIPQKTIPNTGSATQNNLETRNSQQVMKNSIMINALRENELSPDTPQNVKPRQRPWTAQKKTVELSIKNEEPLLVSEIDRASIESRDRQIEDVVQPTFITKREAEELARFIECHSIVKNRPQRYSYEKKTKTGLSKTILIDGRCQKIFILLKGKGHFKARTGSFKKVTSCIMLPFSHSECGRVVVQKVTNDEAAKRHLKEYSREISIMAKLHIPRMPILTSFNYTTVKSDKRIQKISSFEPYFSHDLSKLPEEAKEPQVLLQIVLQTLQSLQHVHEKGYIHGDIKPSNILCRKNGDKYEIALTDFGFAFHYKNEEPIGSLRHGYYGSLWFTAPEAFGTHPYEFDLPTAELWALGLTLYELLYSEYPSTCKYIDTVFETGVDKKWGLPNLIQKLEYKLKVQKVVQEKLKELESDTSLTSSMRALKEVALGLLRADPEKRLSLKQAIEKLQNA